MTRQKRLLLTAAIVFGAAMGSTGWLKAQKPPESPAATFTSAGELLRPEAYREWVFLSSGLGMVYGPAAAATAGRPPAFTNVFVNPAAHRHFITTGTWPDDTVFVLEIRASAAHKSIDQNGQSQGEIVAIEAEVKDRKRFPDGFAYFNFGMKGDRAAPLPADAACYSCHKANTAVEQTFVQFYPTLMPVARKLGTVKPEFLQREAAEAAHSNAPR